MDSADEATAAQVARQLSQRLAARQDSAVAASPSRPDAPPRRRHGRGRDGGPGREEPALAESTPAADVRVRGIESLSVLQIRSAMEDFDPDELAMALRTAGETLKAKVLGSLPPTGARLAREEMERMGPVRLSDVEAAQSHLAETVRRSLAADSSAPASA